jgi:hypothetical protein
MSSFDLPAPLASAVVSMSPSVGLRQPTDNLGPPSAATRTLVYTPDLTVAEQTIFDRLVNLSSSAVLISPTEWQAIESDIDGLITYHNLANPTLAQTVLAVKAQSRILRALLRN